MQGMTEREKEIAQRLGSTLPPERKPKRKDKDKNKEKKDKDVLLSRSLGSLAEANQRRERERDRERDSPMRATASSVSLSLPNSATNTASSQLLPLTQVPIYLQKAQSLYRQGAYSDCLSLCERIYDVDAYRRENLLLLGAVHFQLRNYSESVFFNQQSIRVDPHFAEAYSNLGNALKELGDVKGATQFYLKAVKLKPRYGDAYNNLASAYMLQGQTQQAMETYQMALVIDPDLVDAHTNLGNLFKATGDVESAKRCYLEAIRIKAEFPIAWNNLAGIFKEEGQLATAIAYYREALRLCPEFADAHSNLGNALKEKGLLQDAIQCFQTAIKLRPDFAIAHANLGCVFYDLGDFERAVSSLQYAIQLEPNFPDAYNNLGNALKEQDKLDEAINAYRAALHLKPDHPHAYNNLGNALIEKGYIKEAMHCYVTAIRLLPKFSAAHSNLGSVFKDQGKLQQAISHYLEALRIDPHFADAHCNLGNAYKDAGQTDEAICCYNTAISLEPNYAEAHANLAAALKDAGRLSEAVQLYRKALDLKPDFGEAIANLTHCLTLLCDWKTRADDLARLDRLILTQLASKHAVPAVQPFHALVYPFSLADSLSLARRYAQRAKQGVALSEISFKYRPKPKAHRLRVGYVSSDFANHPVAHSLASLFALHDRERVEVFCYALSPSDGSAVRLRIEESAEHFVDVSALHCSEIAQMINADNIHVLVNLNGYTKGAKNEVFALRPAPVQMSFFGFFGTMGAEYIQYIVADPVSLPRSLRSFYSEKIFSVPHSVLLNDHKQNYSNTHAHARGEGAIEEERESVVSRARYGLSEDKFVYCCFTQLCKIDPEIFKVWMKILKRVPNAVLWLLRFPAAAEANLLREAKRLGVREDRLVFSELVEREEHLQRCALADLALDTLLCNAHTSAADVLWAGTPLLTLPGERMASRISASLLTAAGLEKDLVAKSLEDYEETAVQLAEDSERLYSLRRHLEQTRETSAAFDSARWVRNYETGLRLVWKRQEQNLSAEHVDVEDKEPLFVVHDSLL